MKITYYELKNVYRLKMKIYEPESEIKGYILAVHGFCGDMESSVIKSLAERMTTHGLAVVSFNFPGHGTSEADEYFSLTNCRRDMNDVLKFLAEKYSPMLLKAVFATSFGGYVTLLNLDKIPQITKIILRAPAINMKRSFENFVSDMGRFRKEGFEVMGFEHKLNVPYSFYEELENNYILEKDFDRPLLIIHGDCDDVVLPEDMKIFCENNPLAELEVIKGADHRFKHPNELNRIIDIAEKYIMSIYDDLLTSIQQAIDYENGNKSVARTVSVSNETKLSELEKGLML